MSLYVDPAVWQWRAIRWCHLLADDPHELHEFARRLDIPRRAFQDKRLPHYDLPEPTRWRAVDLGALEVSAREIVLVARRLRIRIDGEAGRHLAQVSRNTARDAGTWA